MFSIVGDIISASKVIKLPLLNGYSHINLGFLYSQKRKRNKQLKNNALVMFLNDSIPWIVTSLSCDIH